LSNNNSLQCHFSDDSNDYDYVPGFENNDLGDCDDDFTHTHDKFGHSSTANTSTRKRHQNVIDTENNSVVIETKRKKKGNPFM
jgi:hypothetical protein